MTVSPAMNTSSFVFGPNAAMRTDVTASTLPAPHAISPVSGMNVAPSCSAAFTSTGSSFGFACSTSAATPDTTAADMLVPLICM